jgi:predicted metal-dependent HD superfamily phosphohydrolase
MFLPFAYLLSRQTNYALTVTGMVPPGNTNHHPTAQQMRGSDVAMPNTADSAYDTYGSQARQGGSWVEEVEM